MACDSTEAYGSWERIDGRLYANTTVFFRFNPQTGAYLGTQKISRTIQLAPDSRTFAVVARVTVLDASGNVLANLSRDGGGGAHAGRADPDLP